MIQLLKLEKPGICLLLDPNQWAYDVLMVNRSKRHNELRDQCYASYVGCLFYLIRSNPVPIHCIFWTSKI